MVAQSISVACASSHIRPFSLRRDLGDLADLVQASFGEELVATGSKMVEEMRQMASLGPLLPLAFLGMPPMRGYVWVDAGRVVGNISLAQERGGRWTLSNVAVLPEMRGQGIAGCLVDAALEHVRRQGGRMITLQVRSDNAPARALYAHRGLAVYDTVHELRLSPLSWPPVLRASHPSIRPRRRDDAPWLRYLIRASIPEGAQRYHVSPDEPAAPGVVSWLRRAWEQLAQPQERPGLVATAGDRPIGLASATTRLLASWHELRLYVAPARRGTVEQPLVEAMLAQLDGAPRREVRATLSTSHPEGIDVLHRLGFETSRVLDQMGCIL